MGYAFRFSGLTASVLLMFGCATPIPAVDTVDPAVALIERYTQSASNSLKTLSDVERKFPSAPVNKNKNLATEKNVDAGDLSDLSKIMKLTWTDDIEYLVDKICRDVGWTKTPSVGRRIAPVIVSINSKDGTVMEVLKDAGGQAGSSAEVLVNPLKKTISIKYPPLVQPSQHWERP